MLKLSFTIFVKIHTRNNLGGQIGVTEYVEENSDLACFEWCPISVTSWWRILDNIGDKQGNIQENVLEDVWKNFCSSSGVGLAERLSRFDKEALTFQVFLAKLKWQWLVQVLKGDDLIKFDQKLVKSTMLRCSQSQALQTILVGENARV